MHLSKLLDRTCCWSRKSRKHISSVAAVTWHICYRSYHWGCRKTVRRVEWKRQVRKHRQKNSLCSALDVSRRLRFPSRQSARVGGKVGSNTHLSPLPPEYILGAHFWVDLRSIVRLEELRVCQWMTSSDTIGNRTRDLRLVVPCLNLLRHLMHQEKKA